MDLLSWWVAWSLCATPLPGDAGQTCAGWQVEAPSAVVADTMATARVEPRGPVPQPSLANTPQDTVRRRSVSYSDWYGRRVTLHRWLAYATVPAFAYQFYLGDRLYDGRASENQRDHHRANAWVLAGLFGANTVTGVWNLWESRHDTNGRGARVLHAASMLVADALFVWAGTLPEDGSLVTTGGDDRSTHRALALSGMGITLVSATWMRFFR